MNTRNIFITAMLSSALFAFTACGDNTPADGTGTTTPTQTTDDQRHEWIDEKQGVATAYQCPMKCEGELVYDAPGRCPVCKMELKPVDDHEGHSH